MTKQEWSGLVAWLVVLGGVTYSIGTSTMLISVPLGAVFYLLGVWSRRRSQPAHVHPELANRYRNI